MTKQEQLLLTRLTRTRKLYRFLREHRHELFDDDLQSPQVDPPPRVGSQRPGNHA